MLTNYKLIVLGRGKNYSKLASENGVYRKNFLFCKTENGADATAEHFSIIQTAQANLLIPDQYLTWTMYNVGKLPIEELLPWSEKIPDEIHIHKKDLEQRTD